MDTKRANEKIEYTLKRGMRKTILLRVTSECKVEVLAPRRISQAFIDGFVESKREWIEKCLEKKAELARQRAAYRMDTLFFLGREYPVRLGKEQEVLFDGSCFRVPRCEMEERRALVKAWYRQQGLEILKKRVQIWAEKMGAEYASVKITDARTRWGSCSGKNQLNFSWRLLFASGRAVDSVVIHELAHTMVHAHSAEFWEIVARYCPDYQEIQEELKALSEKLSVWGWSQ